MLPETLQLERFRQQIQNLEQTITDQTEYIDHGLPNPKQSRKVMKMREQSKQLRAELRSAIDTVRRQRPEAFSEWVNFHKSILERILTEQSTDRNADTRRNLAGLALSNWDKVVSGEREYVFISPFFMKDYDTVVRDLFPQPINTPPETNKSWWQFWK